MTQSPQQQDRREHSQMEIRERMSQVRREIENDVDAVVQNSKSLTDWKQYVRAHPLMFTAGAAVVGFLVVPRKRQYIKPDTDELIRAIKKEKLVVGHSANVSGRSSLLGSLFGLAVSTAARAAISQLMVSGAVQQTPDAKEPDAASSSQKAPN